MDITVYEYDNTPMVFEIPDDKKIRYISVTILSGDEAGYVYFTDGTRTKFDSSKTRFIHDYDGSYRIPTERVNEWLNWKPSGKRMCYSYERWDDFMEDEED